MGIENPVSVRADDVFRDDTVFVHDGVDDLQVHLALADLAEHGAAGDPQLVQMA